MTTCSPPMSRASPQPLRKSSSASNSPCEKWSATLARQAADWKGSEGVRGDRQLRVLDAAVDLEDLAGDPRGGGRRQVDDARGNVVDLAEAGHWRVGDHLVTD